MARTKQTVRKQTARKSTVQHVKPVTFPGKSDKNKGAKSGDGAAKMKDSTQRPELKKGSKKRKGQPMKREERSVKEIREARSKVQLCIPRLPLMRLVYKNL